MNMIGAFLRLIRFPNLFFIALTQLLFYYCIVLPRLSPALPFDQRQLILFLLLVASSVLIAAGGYVINDYFDLNIDQVNKPGKMVVDRIIKRRWAIIWHWLLSTAGVLLGFYISFVTRNWIIGLSNFVCVILLWFYSTSFKKQLLVGNIMISALTAWSVLVLLFFVYDFADGVLAGVRAETLDPAGLKQVIRLAFLYTGFAFIISLARELVKDIEDMEGDARYGCRTMPIVWGVPVTKLFTSVWLVVLAGALLVVLFYAVYLRWWWSVLYGIAFILIPLFWILRNLYLANATEQYHRLSTMIKLLMLSGILSMLFFKLPAS